MAIRAVRNNNPGNIDRGQPWQGLMPVGLMTPEQAAETRFCVFETPAWGFRALVLILLSYSKVFAQAGKVFSVTNIISRWAPPGENNTSAYIAHVCQLAGFDADAALPVTGITLRSLAHAISVHEVGSWAFNEADLALGLNYAGVG